MVTVVRILFGISALVFFFYGGLTIGERTARRMDDPNPGHVVYTAYYVNTIALAVFFTL